MVKNNFHERFKKCYYAIDGKKEVIFRDGFGFKTIRRNRFLKAVLLKQPSLKIYLQGQFC
jgi:hypothetical protein